MYFNKRQVNEKAHVEFLMLRELSEYLSSPVFIFDIKGCLIFYNQAAEEIIGFKFSEQGEILIKEWGNFFLENKKSSLNIREKILSFNPDSNHVFYQKKIYQVKSKKNHFTYKIFSLPFLAANGLIGSAAFLEKVSKD